MLKDDQSKDLFGNWLIQRRGELRKREVLDFILRYTVESAGQDVDLIGQPMSPEPSDSSHAYLIESFSSRPSSVRYYGGYAYFQPRSVTSAGKSAEKIA